MQVPCALPIVELTRAVQMRVGGDRIPAEDAGELRVCGRRKVGRRFIAYNRGCDVSTTRIVIRSQFALLKAVWPAIPKLGGGQFCEQGGVSVCTYVPNCSYIPIVVCSATNTTGS